MRLGRVTSYSSESAIDFVTVTGFISHSLVSLSANAFIAAVAFTPRALLPYPISFIIY